MFSHSPPSASACPNNSTLGTLAHGTTIAARVRDNAGNWSSLGTPVTIQRDTVAPATAIGAITPEYRHTPTQLFYAPTSDGGSPFATVRLLRRPSSTDPWTDSWFDRVGYNLGRMNHRAAAWAWVLWLVGCAVAPPSVPRSPTPTFVPHPFETNADCATLCIRRASSRHVPQWHKLELELATTVQADNPFDPRQIEINVRFASPEGDVLEVPAFFYSHRGRQGWRARFTPTAQGEWRARPVLRAPFTFEGEPVSFSVTEPLPGARGFVRVDGRNPRYLAFDDGTPFFAIGLNLAWWKDDPLGDYRRWFDALQAHGANAARIWMAPQSFSLEWRDTPLGNYAARMDRAYYLDQVFESYRTSVSCEACPLPGGARE